MRVDLSTHTLAGVRVSPSPNFDERPAGEQISLIVIHNISLPPGSFGGPYIEQLFMNQLDSTQHPYFSRLGQLTVSSHLLIRRSGEVIQFVPFHLRAWHAGRSTYNGTSRCNDFSIGIEMEGSDDTLYTPMQYTVLVPVLRSLLIAYPGITKKRITGHSDIAPGRKSDPGKYFDWLYVKNRLV